MHRAILALTLLVGAVVFSHAQDPDRGGAGEAGVPELKLRGIATDVPLSDVIMLASEYSDMVFLYDPKKVAGDGTFVAPHKGVTIAKDDYPMLLQNMLEEFRLCYVKKGDVWVIIPQVEAVTLAPKITVEELASANPAHWAVVHVDLQHLEANSATGALRNLVTRQGGVVNPVQPNGLLICDRVDRLQQIVKTTLDMDMAATPVVRRYPIPEGVDPGQVAVVLEHLFPQNKASVLTFAAAPIGNAVLARAIPSDHEQIATAVKTMGGG